MDKRRSTSFAIMIASLGPVSLVLQQQAALRFSKHRITHLAPMRSVNAFWGVSGESAWIMYWSSMRNSCIGSCVLTSSISTGRDHIKASVSRFLKGKLPTFHQLSLMKESSQFRSEVGYTTSTEEWLECFNSKAEVAEKIAY
jgi:hypothetical protein